MYETHPVTTLSSGHQSQRSLLQWPLRQLALIRVRERRLFPSHTLLQSERLCHLSPQDLRAVGLWPHPVPGLVSQEESMASAPTPPTCQALSSVQPPPQQASGSKLRGDMSC